MPTYSKKKIKPSSDLEPTVRMLEKLVDKLTDRVLDAESKARDAQNTVQEVLKMVSALQVDNSKDEWDPVSTDNTKQETTKPMDEVDQMVDA